MNKSLQIKLKFTTLLLLSMSSLCFANADVPPSITAQGRQAFCIGTPIKIVTDFTITDPDDTTIEAFFIQISSGYQNGLDELRLTGSNPNIRSSGFDPVTGKIVLLSSSSGGEMLLADLENAVKDIVFISSATSGISEKTFSLSIDDANYLLLTDHFYEFVDQQSITWADAKVAAEDRFYYGRRGYLATLTSQEESDFAGKQASGAGWIGGSDEETEGAWKWVTGPEAGTNFWNGLVNGTTPNFAFWNTGEPNDFEGGEDYAHITDPSIGNPGAWNDLPNEGGTGLYIPRGYIVEYGIPSDVPLNIVATTSIYIPEIIATSGATICESGSATITATPSEGAILWFDAQTGGTQLPATGASYTTPVLTNNTTYYAVISLNGCVSSLRTPVAVTVNERPIITATTDDLICSGAAILSAASSIGQINWYNSLTSITPIFTGTNFTTPPLNSTMTYYVGANNGNCEALARTAVTAVVDATIPEFDVMQDVYVLCNDVGSITIEISDPQAIYRYVWKKEGALISGSRSSTVTNDAGNYTVSGISKAGCESEEKTISVRNSEKATLTKDDFIIVDNSANNTIYVNNPNLGIGDYEFALDDEFGVYREQGFFSYISAGTHTLYIRDQIGCGTQEYKFSILEYPKFFTPNEDGDNDIWIIEGYDKDFYTISEVYIYNRFGNLIYTIDKTNEGWNGNFEGKKSPSNDYWFKTILTDVNGYSTEKTGNFSLLR